MKRNELTRWRDIIIDGSWGAIVQPGLSVIVSAIIGARKIFQRMTTYSKYTVAMTFRICFTFGLLTVLYNFYFPTVLIVLLAVFNDGAMIALSKVHSDMLNIPCLVCHWSHSQLWLCNTLASFSKEHFECNHRQCPFK